MGNNVGLTTKTLPRIIGDTITYNMGTESTTIIIISGMMDVGCLLFDSDGTMGVCTEVVDVADVDLLQGPAVVEGVGEHGCEYMTGGKVVVLGPTDKNFAAGMSGGIAYVLDEQNKLYKNLNKEMVLMEKVEYKADKEELKSMLEKHVKYTGSTKAKAILDDFENYLPKFKKIIPSDYKKIMQLTEDFIERGMSLKEAQIEAFNECTK